MPNVNSEWCTLGAGTFTNTIIFRSTSSSHYLALLRVPSVFPGKYDSGAALPAIYLSLHTVVCHNKPACSDVTSRNLITGELYHPSPDHTITLPGQGWLYRKFTRRDMVPTLGDAAADFAIFCERRCFMTHKFILAESSPYFQRMFRFRGLVRFMTTQAFQHFLITPLGSRRQ